MIRIHCDTCGDDITDDTPDCWPEHHHRQPGCDMADDLAIECCCPDLCARCCPHCREAP
jgi:hypothetical protein